MEIVRKSYQWICGENTLNFKGQFSQPRIMTKTNFFLGCLVFCLRLQKCRELTHIYNNLSENGNLNKYVSANETLASPNFKVNFLSLK